MSGEAEEWLPIEGGPGHYVSNTGRVRRRDTILKHSKRGLGYHSVYLSGAGRGPGRNAYVHHLVAEAFLGPRPDYLAVARHLNDVKADNRLKNLAWGTRKENAADMRRNREAIEREFERQKPKPKPKPKG